MSSDQPPLVSVVIPAVGEGDQLRRSVWSVLDQSYTNFELIIVDDSGTGTIAGSSIIQEDARIECIQHPRNRGPSAARNSGLGSARGELVAFLDADDEWTPDRLIGDIRTFRQEDEVGLVYCSLDVRRSDNGRSLGIQRANRSGHVHADLLAGDFVGTPTRVTVLTEAVRERDAKFRQEVESREDWDFWLQIAKEWPIDGRHAVGAIQYVGHTQITGDERRTLRGTEMVLELHRHSYRQHPQVYGKSLGNVALRWLVHDIEHGRQLASRALNHYLWQLRVWIALALVAISPGLFRACVRLYRKTKMLAYQWREQPYARREMLQ